jgi:hypothetical protein
MKTKCQHEKTMTLIKINQRSIVWCEDCGSVQFPGAMTGWMVPNKLAELQELSELAIAGWKRDLDRSIPIPHGFFNNFLI